MDESTPEVATNIVEISVSDLSFAIKRTLEGAFDQVRVRGEVSGYRGPHTSGHAYFALKDENARMEAVIWKSTFRRLEIKPEEGMEVLVTGRVTTYPRSSKYQIVIERLEPAGAGALMALLEERRKKLAAEGLFATERKRPLPYLPTTIGIVTSPTGAVIRDILHRLSDRFPVRVLVWPVPVQGEGSAEKIAAAISGFNALRHGGAIPRPDVLIVARGGGSIEDLWAFNEEAVVRSVAASDIPVISAVGHETDVTLADHAADRRAPTPTGAAEFAVPVRTELLATLSEWDHRLAQAMIGLNTRRRRDVAAIARALPALTEILALPRQRLDNSGDRLLLGLTNLALRKRQAYAGAETRLRPDLLARLAELLSDRLEIAAGRRDRAISARITNLRSRAGMYLERMGVGLIGRSLSSKADRIADLSRLLSSLDYRSVLRRGYALVWDAENLPVRSAASVRTGQSLDIQFADGHVPATADDPAPGKDGAPRSKSRPSSKKKLPPGQGDLF